MAVSTISRDLIIIESVSLGTLTADSNGYIDKVVNVSSQIPSGYDVSAVIPRNSGSYAYGFYTCQKETATSVHVQLARRTGNATSVAPRVALICQRSN